MSSKRCPSCAWSEIIQKYTSWRRETGIRPCLMWKEARAQRCWYSSADKVCLLRTNLLRIHALNFDTEGEVSIFMERFSSKEAFRQVWENGSLSVVHPFDIKHQSRPPPPLPRHARPAWVIWEVWCVLWFCSLALMLTICTSAFISTCASVKYRPALSCTRSHTTPSDDCTRNSNGPKQQLRFSRRWILWISKLSRAVETRLIRPPRQYRGLILKRRAATCHTQHRMQHFKGWIAA